MAPRKVPLLHLTTTFLVTVSLRRTITPFTIGMQVCNFLVTRRFPRSQLRDFTVTSALPVGKDRTKFASCMKKVLVLDDIFQDSIRARDTLRHLARSLPTLLLSDGFKTIQTRCNRLLKGDSGLEWLWASCTKLGRAR